MVFEVLKLIDSSFSRASIKPLSELENLLELIIDFDSNAGLTFSLSEIMYRRQLNPNITIFVCPEVFITIPSVIYTTKNFYLVDALNEKIENLKVSGLIDYWQKKAFTESSRHPIRPESRQAIKLTHLWGCFQICLCCLVVSLLVFLGEIISSRFLCRR